MKRTKSIEKTRRIGSPVTQKEDESAFPLNPPTKQRRGGGGGVGGLETPPHGPPPKQKVPLEAVAGIPQTGWTNYSMQKNLILLLLGTWSEKGGPKVLLSEPKNYRGMKNRRS